MHRNLPKVAVLLMAIFFLVACSEPPKTASVQASTTAAAPTGPVSGKTAFWEMYKTAYAWSKDSVPLKLESKTLAGVANDAGNAGLWTGTFGSASKRELVEISYSVAAQLPDLAKGVNVGHELPWAGPSHEVMPFQGSDIGVDSDAVYKTASEEAASWVKAHPGQQPTFLLGNNTRTFATPVWYVAWGDKKAGYRVFVNSKTGQIAKPLK